MAKAFGPAYYRFGGTIADWLIFNETQTHFHDKLAYNVTNITISSRANFLDSTDEFLAQQLDQLYNFTKNAGWRLIFDMNLELFNRNQTNAIQLLNYTSSKGYDFDFELGNGKIKL